MKKALLVLDINETGGTGVFAKRLVSFLASRYRVRVVLNGRGYSSALIGFFRGKARSITTSYSLFPSIDMVFSKIARRLGLSLFYDFVRDGVISNRLLRNYRPDLVVISQGGGCRYFRFLLAPLPVIVVTHSLLNDEISLEKFGRRYIRLYDKLDTRGKRVVTVSGFAASLFKRNFRNERVAAVLRSIPNYGEDLGSERKVGERLLVLTLGHVEGYKNPEIWLETALRLTRRYPRRLKFVWAGVGSRLEEFRRKAAPNPDIAFIGFRDDTAALYGEADIYFQPSLWESQGIAVVEAMGAGLPSVVSSAGGLPESVEHGVEGFVCEPNSVEGYLDALARLVDDQALRRELGTNARGKYLRLFTKTAWEAKLSAILDEVDPVPMSNQHNREFLT